MRDPFMTLDRGHHIYVLALNRLTLRSRSERRDHVGRSGSEVSSSPPPHTHPAESRCSQSSFPQWLCSLLPGMGNIVPLDRTLVSCLDSKFSRGNREVEERLPVICQARFFCVRKLTDSCSFLHCRNWACNPSVAYKATGQRPLGKRMNQTHSVISVTRLSQDTDLGGSSCLNAVNHFVNTDCSKTSCSRCAWDVGTRILL